jgi:hypothetical protein
MSIPMTAISAVAVLVMGVLLAMKPLSVERRSLVGQEHGRTIPLPDSLLVFPARAHDLTIEAACVPLPFGEHFSRIASLKLARIRNSVPSPRRGVRHGAFKGDVSAGGAANLLSTKHAIRSTADVL